MSSMIGSIGVGAPTELEVLKASSETDMWGSAAWAADLLSNGGAIINVNLPPYMARTWQVNLQKMRYRAGIPGVASRYVGDPDSQFAVEARVRVQWGVAGAREVAEVDYPASGGTFQITAANVLVSAIVPEGPRGTNLETYPTLGAFLSPAPASRAVADLPPTLTQRVGTFEDDDDYAYTNLMSRPARAVAWRLLPDPNDATFRFIVLERRSSPGGGTPVTRDYGSEAVDDPVTGGLVARRQIWTQLAPTCTGLEISTTAGSRPDDLRVQWLLDLG
jgi:hypothetical protein